MSAVHPSPKHYIALAKTLPKPLLTFLARYPPPQVLGQPEQKVATGYQADVHNATHNPFLTTVHPVTQRRHDPVYSLRRQAVLVKHARKHGIEDLLPWSSKKTEVRLAKKVEFGSRVKGTGVGQRVKGHKFERGLNSKYVVVVVGPPLFVGDTHKTRTPPRADWMQQQQDGSKERCHAQHAGAHQAMESGTFGLDSHPGGSSRLGANSRCRSDARTGRIGPPKGCEGICTNSYRQKYNNDASHLRPSTVFDLNNPSPWEGRLVAGRSITCRQHCPAHVQSHHDTIDPPRCFCHFPQNLPCLPYFYGPSIQVIVYMFGARDLNPYTVYVYQSQNILLSSGWYRTLPSGSKGTHGTRQPTMAQPPPTHYEVLALPRALLEDAATPEQTAQLVKRAYHRALLRHHPDKAVAPPLSSPPPAPPSSSSSAPPRPPAGTTPPYYTIDQIITAYTTLSTPSAKKSYDQSLQILSNNWGDKSGSGNPDTTFQTGIEIIDLDDLSTADETSCSWWWKACRCGNPQGFRFGEADLEEAGDLGELIVGCQDCSLWLRVHFAVVEDDGENGLDVDGRTGP